MSQAPTGREADTTLRNLTMAPSSRLLEAQRGPCEIAGSDLCHLLQRLAEGFLGVYVTHVLNKS